MPFDQAAGTVCGCHWMKAIFCLPPGAAACRLAQTEHAGACVDTAQQPRGGGTERGRHRYRPPHETAPRRGGRDGKIVFVHGLLLVA